MEPSRLTLPRHRQSWEGAGEGGSGLETKPIRRVLDLALALRFLSARTKNPIGSIQEGAFGVIWACSENIDFKKRSYKNL